MAIYRFKAKKGPDDIVEQNIEAASESEAVEKITQMGYLPMRIEEVSAVSAARNIPESKVKLKIRSRDLTIFSRQLASLLKSGVPILSALNIISEQAEDVALKGIIRSIHSSIKEGARFSSVLAEYPSIFSSLYIALIRAGEDSGSLSESLLRIADYRTKQEEMLSRFRMALAYPILMAVVGMGTVIFMLTFVMPRLLKIFLDMGQNLPLPTKILISVSTGLRQWWVWAVLAAAILIIIRQTKTKTAKFSLSVLSLRIPVFGAFVLKTELARFCRTLELLLKSGIPILKAINIAIPVIDNELIKEQLKISYKELEQGGSFGKSLKNSRLFPLFLTNLIIVGEESGKLNDALSESASSYERDTDESIRVLANLLEPLMILVMGLIVGFIVVAMLLPIFEINVMTR